MQPKIYDRWPPQHPDRIQLYSLPTPNGVKVSTALEEMELPYEAHRISLSRGDQHTPEFLSLNPNGKIPALIDPNGPNGQLVQLMESAAIVWYLAEKTGKLIPSDPIKKSHCMQWLFFQMGHIGPMFGQFGHFHMVAGARCEHPYPLERYKLETQRLLGVLEARLQECRYILGSEYTIADIMIFPWVRTLENYYKAGELLELNKFPRVQSWLSRCLERPAVQAGLTVCS